MNSPELSDSSIRTGWASTAGRVTMAVLLFESVTGLLMTFGPFHGIVQWGALLHSAVGLVALPPVCWYCAVHWIDYRRQRISHVVLLGYLASAALLVCILTGLFLTWQGLFQLRTSPLWRNVHLISTFAVLATTLPHLFVLLPRLKAAGKKAPAGAFFARSVAGAAVGMVLVALLSSAYAERQYVNEFPEDYQYPYGEDRPFAPSLANTDTGGAFDPLSLSGSRSCGTAGCHEQILKEWLPSSHRYSAMDPLFQTVQEVMAKQNGPESTRYCGGCHDPISLFSGTKNLFVDDLTVLEGYQEGVSCLVCHAIRETDLQGNANYVITQHPEYLWQWRTEGPARVARDFLIRTYPRSHNTLSKRMFKSPEYCAACHKQFIDQEVNKVGWVQLQNQYDNWAASRWRVEGDPTRTIECRECHMPLVESTDPSSGDPSDYNRDPGDGKHRSHGFAGANTLVPALLDLEGQVEHIRSVEQWLKGEFEIPEISDKWVNGPIVELEIDVPGKLEAGGTLPLRVVFKSNKVGHDFPTGPLDIIQSWLEIHVTDEEGREVFTSGTRNEKNFIEPGTFLFKAEPVDQYGNLIDRHNLWEMVGVRYRRAIFPGYSDTVDVEINCDDVGDQGCGPGRYHVVASLQYRKVDQYLINFLLGEDSGLTAPVVELNRTEATVEVMPL
jgi:hypothetical protein